MTRQPMKVAIGLHRDRIDDWDSAALYAQEAEKLGVFSIWSAEAWGYDGITPLAYLAGKTETIKLGSGIIQGGTRTPALVGMTAMSLQSMSGGRFMLGLGTSGPQVIEGWHGVPFAGAVSRLKETAEIVRMVCNGERVVYNGRHYTLPLPGGEGKAIRSGSPPVEPPPIYMASLGRRSLQMCGEFGDGWLASSFIPETANVFFDDIRIGADRAGRSIDEIDLEAGGGVVFSDDPETGRRTARARYRLHARRDGLGQDQLLQRRLLSPGLGRRGQRSPTTLDLRRTRPRTRPRPG